MSARELARDVRGAPVTVMGLGLFGGGVGVARHLASRGARVTVTDLRTADELAPAIRALAGVDVRFVLGEHRREDFENAALVVANPAVSPASEFLAAARAGGAAITSEIALFLELCPARIAAVTGTQGKSSTCNALHQLLVASGLRAHLGGNIGGSLLDAASQMDPDDVVVLELSSYQLETLPRRLGRDDAPPRVEVVCVTNVLSDHLERHGTIEAYAAAKARILELVERTHGKAVLSAEDPRIAAWRGAAFERVDVHLARTSERGLDVNSGWFRLDGERLARVDDVRLPGEFQRENVLCALGMARLLGASAARLAAALPRVRGLPHRLEDLGTFRGHRVFDNGVSTTPDSTIGVLGSLSPGFALLVGGKAKNLPLEGLVEAARGKVRRVVAFGAASETFAAAFRAAGFEAHASPTLRAAVERAFISMEPGEELLFSPAAASFDGYLNFKERALDFRRSLPPRDDAAEARLDAAEGVSYSS